MATSDISAKGIMMYHPPLAMSSKMEMVSSEVPGATRVSATASVVIWRIGSVFMRQGYDWTGLLTTGKETNYAPCTMNSGRGLSLRVHSVELRVRPEP